MPATMPAIRQFLTTAAIRGPLCLVVAASFTLAACCMLLGPAQVLADPGSVLFAPGGTDQTSYARVIELQHSGAANGTLLATHEYSAGSTPSFPVYQSTNGATWTLISHITDTHDGWGMKWQPFLFELPRQLGSLQAGTILAAGNAFPATGTPTHDLEVYYSDDHGYSWNYLSSCATDPTGAGLWEPSLQVDASGNLVCYFSDERHKADGYDQLIGHVVSADGVNWGTEVYDVARADGTSRPGMPTVVKLPNGTYIMNVEGYCPVGSPPACPPHSKVLVKTSLDGDHWGDLTSFGSPVQTGDGQYLGGTPYVTWSPAGGPNGELIASGHDFYAANDTQSPEDGTILMVNYDLGQGSWYKMTAPFTLQPYIWGSGTDCVSWSSPLQATGDGSTLLEMAPTYLSPGRCQISFGSANAGVLPYSDPFAGGRDSGWVTYGGTWSASNGIYTDSAGGAGDKALTGSTAWTDYTLQGDVELTSGNGNAGLLIRVTNPTTGVDTLTGYMAGIASDGTFFLGRENAGTWTGLANGGAIPGGFSLNTWYHITVEAAGCELTVSVGAAGSSTVGMLQYTDTGCTVTRQGQIGVRTYNAAAAWRNITATPIAVREAERAVITDAIVYTSAAASGGAYVGGINNSDSSVAFQNVWAPVAGTYGLLILYANGSGAPSTHNLSINGGTPIAINYPTTAGWGQFGTTIVDVSLQAGDNTLTFTKGTLYAELDAIKVLPRYEAENATTHDVIPYSSSSASGGAYIGGINNADSFVSFGTVSVPQAGSYQVRVRYANGSGAASTHNISVNGIPSGAVTYPPTAGWGQFGYTTFSVTLNAGVNAIQFSKGTLYAELDCIDVYQ